MGWSITRIHFRSRKNRSRSNTVHFVEDRLGRFRIKPLAGSFRVRGPDPAQAFTFTLINVETDPEQTGCRTGPICQRVPRRAERWPQ